MWREHLAFSSLFACMGAIVHRNDAHAVARARNKKIFGSIFKKRQKTLPFPKKITLKLVHSWCCPGRAA
jgi:hypothetical protein